MKHNDHFSIGKYLFIFIFIFIFISLRFFYTQLFKEYEKTGNILFLIGGILIFLFLLNSGFRPLI